jgi:TPR repeat protein
MAQAWYRRAVALGWPAAQIALVAMDGVAVGREARSGNARRGNTPERRGDESRWLKVEERGDAEARYYLGQMFEQGLGVDMDVYRAQALYQLAARQGEARAQYALARLAQERYDPQALEWFDKAAHNGNAPAQCVLGEHHAQGIGMPRDTVQGLHWYLRASEQGYLPALKGLHGLLEQEAGSMALAILVRAAEAGDAASQHLLAQRCAQGDGLAASPSQALHWWEAAAAQGYAPAQCALGLQWLSGRHLERNAVQALHWLTLAAEQQDARAQWNLGSLYASGAPGVDKDLIQAFEWCHRAAQLVFVPAQATLGVLHARMGESAKALHWWALAAQGGDVEAQFNLATALLAGPDGAPDAERAFHWFYQAANQGLAPAQTKVGILYATGQGVAQDAIEAHKWFEIAARQGDRAARENVVRSADQITPLQQREALRRADAFKPEASVH